MRRLLAVGLTLGVAAMTAQGFAASGSDAADDNVSAPVTFNKDVLPILQKNCQTCHRPGELGPMSLLTYESTRPWARAMKEAVLTKKMPPWFADAQYGHFRNAPKLTEADRHTIATWVDNGAPEGDAKGVVELASITVPTNFTKDTWITSIEVRPSNPAVVHHVVMSFIPHREDTKYGVPRFTEKARDDEGVQVQRITRTDDERRSRLGFINLETVFVPGTPPVDFRIHNSAKLIPAGYDISIQMHYTPVGEETTDQTRVGLTLAKAEPTRQFITMSPTSPHDAERFRIPANDPNWESTTEVEFTMDAEIVWFMPHMHLRGKDMTYTLKYPDGRSEIVLSVPKYDFEWQLGYDVEKPINVPKGAKLFVSAHYDNSRNNRFNPNPDRDVWWGDQTWEEMMVPWFGVVVEKGVDPKSVMNYTTGAR